MRMARLAGTRTVLVLAFVAIVSRGTGGELHPVVPPTPAKESESDIQILPGFRMRLLASEPLVTDPVAFCYDADGRAYVAEMNDYPYTDKGQHRPMQENPTDEAIGKVRLLVDDTGDGVFDRSTVFVDGLSWPTGVVPWKGGVFITAVPDLWYCKDTDGDGKADVKEKVMTGFRKYNVQSGANTPIWGLDNRIYISAARNGGELSAPGKGTGDPQGIPAGRDIRFDARDPEDFEFVSGGIQFGNTFDDWGNRFLCSAGGSVHHTVLPSWVFERNPWLPTKGTVAGCIEPDRPVQLYPITPIEGWRLQRYKDRKFVPRPGYTESRGANPGEPSRPTSSCGVAVYRGDAYPADYRGEFFVAESCYSLVYRLKAERRGPSFVVSKPDQEDAREFIASRDVWFRPIALVNAPDGCLHLADFYRESIEHPWSLPDAFHEEMDLLRGRDRGRLYRIEPEDYRNRVVPKLSEASGSELVQLLGHANAWHRETAHRLLFERQDKSVVPLLKTVVLTDSEKLARLHALWVLHGLDALEEDVLVAGMKDSSPLVRSNAASIANLLCRDMPGLRSPLADLADDVDPAVRFQTSLALGALDSKQVDNLVSDALVRIALEDSENAWSRMALLSSSVPHALPMMKFLMAQEGFSAKPGAKLIITSLAKTVGAGGSEEDRRDLLSMLASRVESVDSLGMAVAVEFADGLRLAKGRLSDVARTIAAGPDFLAKLVEKAKAISVDSSASVDRRVDAIAFLRNADYDSVSDILIGLLDPHVPGDVQARAASMISILGAGRDEIGTILLQGWEGYGGELRNSVLQLVLARKERIGPLLDAIESGKVAPYQMGASWRSRLMDHNDPEVAKRAKALFSQELARDKVLERYRDSLTDTGDPSKGETVYSTVCMSCHKFREKGAIEMGPNLAVVSDWEKDRILTNVIDPNREVAPEYMEFVVETTGGEMLAGRVAGESPSGISLRMIDNSTRDIPRAEIQKLTNSGRSLMPEGLEAAITPESMNDLIAYLMSK